MTLAEFFKKLFSKKTKTPEIKPPEIPSDLKPGDIITTEPAHAENPAYKEAKKYAGKTEYDSNFNKFMSGFWKLVGLPNYKTIVGTSFAWCALFVFGMNTEVGQEAIASASARKYQKYGQTVDWKVNGIPQGAVVQINHNYDCGSSKGNHVGFADGDCTVEDLNKSGLLPIYGGNQNNTVQRSMYSIKEICHVGWPEEKPLPSKITKSINCSGKKTSESTQ